MALMREGEPSMPLADTQPQDSVVGREDAMQQDPEPSTLIEESSGSVWAQSLWHEDRLMALSMIEAPLDNSCSNEGS